MTIEFNLTKEEILKVREREFNMAIKFNLTISESTVHGQPENST